MRYNIGFNKKKDLDQVGRDFNATRKRIQEIEKKALEKSRNHPPDDAA